MKMVGGCHCGDVRYEAEGPPVRHSVCHCTDCRRSSGAPMVAWAIFPEDKVKLTKGEVKTRASSEHGRRQFCPTCGTGLFYTNGEVLPGLIDLQSATLDDPNAVPPIEQIQVAERIGWVARLGELPAHDRYPPDIE